MSSTPEVQSLRQEVEALRQRVAELEHANGANQALRESEARLQQFFSAAFEGIVIHDHGRILDANDALAAMIGVPRAALIGQHILSVVAPESQEAVRRILTHPNGERHEVTGLRNDGSTFPVAARAKDFPLQGRMVRVAVVQDLSDERHAQQQLVSYATQLESLSRRLFEVQEQERRHLARELHDEIGQMLTGLNLTLETVARQAVEPSRAQIGEAQNLLRDLTGRVRELSLRLRPSMLDDLGLLPTVLWQVERFSTTTHIHITVQHSGVERRFPTEIETAAYRVVQEALTNVARHAQVSDAIVRLWFDDHRLTVQVQDHGQGFDAQAGQVPGRTSGLSGMRERVLLLGGEFHVVSRSGAGTTVTADFPVRDDEQPLLSPAHDH